MDSRLDDLIADWLSYHRELERQGSLANDRNTGSQYFESIDALDEMVSADPENGWQAIQVIFSSCENDFQRACLAAGLLEDLLVKHGPEFVDRVELAARNDDSFRELLTGVWRNTIENAVWQRIERLQRELAGENSGRHDKQ